MSAETTESINFAPALPGRPRDDTREQAILDAALALVAEVGFERLTMDAIASRAKASKATMYRRWASKHELVVDAMRCHVGTNMCVPDDTGTLRGDLLALVAVLTRTMTGFDGHLILGLAQAALTSPGLCAALEEQTGAEKQVGPRIVVERAVDRGELPVDADPRLFNEIASPIAIMRLVNGLGLDDQFLEHLVDDILIPALNHSSVPVHPVPAHPVPDTPVPVPPPVHPTASGAPSRSNQP